MISKIILNKVTSYQDIATFSTDKKVNLLYGLNGSGKTTISNYLYNVKNDDFSACSISGLDQETKILVYNQEFIQDNFYHSDELNGIFTLSKENKAVEEKIKELIKKKKELEDKKEKIEKEDLPDNEKNIKDNLDTAENSTWKIKTKYSGDGKIFDFCLEGLKGTKSKLFNYILSLDKLDTKPEKSIKNLEDEAKALQDSNAKDYNGLPDIKMDLKNIESHNLLSKTIVGNEDTVISELIKKLKNADWVRQGLSFLPSQIENKEKCPFCQQETITKGLFQEIKDYFDESYQRDIEDLERLLKDYQVKKDSLVNKEIYLNHPIFDDNKQEFESLFSQFVSTIDKNIQQIKQKIETPSIQVTLDKTDIILQKLNTLIEQKNLVIDEHNSKLQNKKEELSKIKDYFWQIQRYEYAQTIDRYLIDIKKNEKNKDEIVKNISDLGTQIEGINEQLSEEQRKTVNIEEAIESINKSLSELGLMGFSIEKYSKNKYKLKRNHVEDRQTFHTLSEGEKMIISFLYFVEQCRGKMDTDETISKKIIVIDDPMSSLSHLFVFNIAQLIKREFFNGNYEQVFVLTHSLYFFYELTDTNHERRKENQKLFRVQKNIDGSFISEMKYEEIQNDYQAYWMIINDENQHPAVIANAMRNIVEYFFNFVEKSDFNNVFQKPELKQDKYISFNRYMNRESHSLGQNIFDYKEFDYRIFREGLKYIFEKLGYSEHYKKMARI